MNFSRKTNIKINIEKEIIWIIKNEPFLSIENNPQMEISKICGENSL